MPPRAQLVRPGTLAAAQRELLAQAQAGADPPPISSYSEKPNMHGKRAASDSVSATPVARPKSGHKRQNTGRGERDQGRSSGTCMNSWHCRPDRLITYSSVRLEHFSIWFAGRDTASCRQIDPAHIEKPYSYTCSVSTCAGDRWLCRRRK